MTPEPLDRRMPSAVLAEDEPLLAEELREMLATLWPELAVLAVAHDGLAALQSIESLAPDFAFLDIHMPRLSGLDIARRVGDRCHVAFISAYDQHAFEAFEVGGVDYVLKPLAASRLLRTIDRFKSRLGGKPPDLQHALQQLSESYGTAERRNLRWINVSRGTAIQLIMVGDVLYFRADSKYTLVTTATGESVIRKTIRELCDELDPTSFWQVHRSTIVNVHAIDRLLRDARGNMSIRLKGRQEMLPVSTQYHALFRQM